MFVCDCNYDVNIILKSIEQVDKVIKAKAVEENNKMVIALKTKPIYTLSEKQELLYNIKNLAQTFYSGKIIVTTNSEIYCDIINFEEKITNITKSKIIYKAENYNENV